jgi:4-carboxymuconolactone decarboxylase
MDEGHADRDRRTRGIAAYARQFGLDAAGAEAHMRGLVGDRMAEEAFHAAGGTAWADDVLALRDRSLVVVAALVAQGGVDARLRGHLRWAVEHGVTREQLEAAIALLAVYVGYPRAAGAMEVLRDELGSGG